MHWDKGCKREYDDISHAGRVLPLRLWNRTAATVHSLQADKESKCSGG
jgi:hypothetical protein